MRPVGVTKEGKKGQKLSYLKFHENRSRGLRAVGGYNRPLLLTWPMAYTTACPTVQVVMLTIACCLVLGVGLGLGLDLVSGW